jgi:hypothetical protein
MKTIGRKMAKSIELKSILNQKKLTKGTQIYLRMNFSKKPKT